MLKKPGSDQECSEDHERYALHKIIRREECPLSEKILKMEKKFARLLKLYW